jgi:hypothetical protein
MVVLNSKKEESWEFRNRVSLHCQLRAHTCAHVFYFPLVCCSPAAMANLGMALQSCGRLREAHTQLQVRMSPAQVLA